MHYYKRIFIQLLVVITQVALLHGATLQYGLDSIGLPDISYNGLKIFKPEIPFWAANWKYVAISMKPVDNKIHQWHGASRGALNFSLDTTWSVAKENEMIGTFTFDVKQTADPAIGGGIEFNLPLATFKKDYGATDPVMLDNNSGWEWQIAPGKTLQVTSSPKLPNIYFERGNKNRIRCMFFDKRITAGKHTFTIKVTLPKDNRYKKSESERYGIEKNPTSWIQNALNPTKSFIDLSHLNHKPAGKYGMVKTVGDHFEFSNGTPIRFWGANIQAYTLFMQDRKLIKAHAKRLAALGFNLVRLHHMDSQVWVNPCLIKMGPTSQELNPEALDTYFYWIKCLKDEGIYIWIDLHVGRTIRKGDNVPGFDELEQKARSKKAGAEFKGYCYVNDRITELMQDFNKKLLTTINPYTGKALKDEPAIMTFMLTNENDLTHYFGNALLRDKNVPTHNKLFKTEALAFATKTGLDINKLQQTWLPGPSKLLLNNIEYNWNVEMIRHLRKLGVKQPIDTGHMWGSCPLFSLPALTAGDMIDTHTYYGGQGLMRNPRGGGGAVEYIARSQVAGMPLTTTEWNNEDSRQLKDTFVFPIMIGAMAAFQGWDAPMIYGYSQDALREDRISDWSVHNIPTTLGVMPALALLYREQHVQEAEKTFVAKLTKQTLFMQGQGAVEPAFSTLSMMHKVMVALPAIKELPWLIPSKTPAEATIFTDLNKDFIPSGQTYVESDTGELRRDWEKGIMTIDTEKTQAVTGWLKDETIHLKDVSIKINNPKAAVIITSLENNSISKSKRILVTAIGRLDRKQKRSEPVSGTIRIKNKATNMILTPLTSDGQETTPIKLKKSKGAFEIILLPNMKTHWFLLKTINN